LVQSNYEAANEYENVFNFCYYRRMPEVDIQIPEVQEGDCEVKPGGVKYEVILEDAKGGHAIHL
jgi:hypothetical protein